MTPSRTIVFGFLLLTLIALAFAIVFPSYGRGAEVRKLSRAEETLRRIIEAEDQHYQKTGTYFPLEIDPHNSSVKRILGSDSDVVEGSEYAVAVSARLLRLRYGSQSKMANSITSDTSEQHPENMLE